MGKIKQPTPVKLIASLFTSQPKLLDTAQEQMAKRFGPVDCESPLLPFDHTDYYTPEFGPGLVRRIIAFAKLIDPGQLAEIKRWTNELEETWVADGKRRINIDPGYVSGAKLVLASTKNHGHRIYLGGGVYAEVTLRYYRGSFRAWEWSYPDYASQPYIALFNDIRALYMQQIKESRE